MTSAALRRARAADAVIHIIGVAAAATGAPLLIVAAMARQGPLPVATAAVYGLALVMTLTLSGAYNLLADGSLKEKLRPCDHAAIFLLIAGTYTPFALVTIGGVRGWLLCAGVWLVAIAGAALKFLHRRRYERIFVVLYLALGWAGVPALGILMTALSTSAFVFLMAGGILYTTGIAFHIRDEWPYSTAIWHAFVLLAAACHYFAVLLALAPRG